MPVKTESPSGGTILSVRTENIFREDFDKNERQWEESDTIDLFEKIDKGSYTIHFIRNTGIVYSSVKGLMLPGNYVISADFAKCDGKPGHAYGLVWGMLDTDNCYMVVITDNGYYTYGYTRRGAFTPVKDWTGSKSLNSGNSKNSISVKRRGKSLELFFNGRYECDVPYGEPFGDRIGFIVYPTICVTIDSVSVSSYSLSFGEPGSLSITADEAYETADFDLLDTDKTPDSKYCFGLQPLVLRASDQALRLIEKNETDKALGLLERLIGHAKKIEPLDEDILAFLLKKTGTTLYDLRRYEEALVGLNDALILCRENDKIAQCADIAALIGTIHESFARFDRAVAYYSDALAFADKEKDQAEKSKNLRSLGRCYAELGEYDKASDAYMKALSIDEGRNSKTDTSTDAIGAARSVEKLGRIEEALALYKKALAYSRESKDEMLIKECSFESAIIEYDLEYYPASLVNFEIALKSANAVKDIDTTIACLSRIADILAVTGTSAEAIKAYESAISFAEKNNRTDSLFGMREKLYAMHAESGDIAKSIALLYSLAADEYYSKKPGALASLYTRTGMIHFDAGNIDSAITDFLKASDLYESSADFANLSKAYGSIASCYSSTGKPALAFDLSGKSVRTAESHNAGKALSEAYFEAASLSYDWGDYEYATNLLLKSIGSAVKTSYEESRVRSLVMLSKIYETHGSWNTAKQYCDEALTLSRETKKQKLISDTMVYSAQFYDRSGDRKKASGLFAQAIDLSEKTGIATLQVTCHEGLALLLMQDEDYRVAQDRLIKAFAIAEKNEDMFETARITGAIGDIAFKLGNYKKAGDDYSRAISIVEKLIRSGKQINRSDLVGFEIERCESLSDALIASGFPIPAFDAKAKAYSLSLAETIGLPDFPGIPQGNSFDAMRRALPRDTALVSYSVGNADDILVLCATDKGIRSYTATISLVFDRLAQELSLESGNMRTFENEAMETENRFLVSRGIGSKKRQFASIVAYYLSLLSSQSSDNSIKSQTDRIARALHDLIFSQIQSFIKGKTRLIVIPDYPIGILPVETLKNDAGNFLVSDYSISYAGPSGLPVFPEKNTRLTNSFKGLVISGSNASKASPVSTDAIHRIEDSRFLRFVKADSDIGALYLYFGTDKNKSRKAGSASDTLALIFPGWEILKNSASGEKILKSVLSLEKSMQYDAMHFSGTIEAFPAIPRLSSIYLGANDESSKQDGFLDLREISGLDIRADCVSVSAMACDPTEAGTGRVLSAITESMIKAGTKGVLFPILETDVKKGDDFFAKVHALAKEKKLSYPDALCELKRQMIEAGNGSPYPWAGFVYFGR